MLKSLCKEFFLYVDELDTEDKESVYMLQILARSFGLNIYVDGLYGAQTKEAAANIMKLDKGLNPSIITLPANINESKLAPYRR